jgi:peptidyl-prolyl cis-trans isomerase D
MLEFMRAASQGFAGRAIMTVVLGVIVFSFALWGAGDAFRGYGGNKLASVGGAVITPEEFRSEYQNTLQQYQRQLRAPLTGAQAHAMGIDGQVLGRMIGETALNEQARSLGLGISDDEIAKAIRAAPRFQDPSGAFNRAAFDAALRDSGLSERGFFQDQRKSYLRQQIGLAIAAGLVAPKSLIEALAHYQSESRAIDYVTLPAAAAGDIPTPTPEQLQSFFNDHKATFRAPEYRTINILAVTPTTIAKPQDVTDADARAAYDKVKDERFGVPEKRTLQQIVFPNDAEASEASAKIKAGATFEDIAKARNLTDKDIDLGETTKAGVFDKAIADAAFALPEGGVSDVVKGQFGPAILRVTKVVPGRVKPFEEVADNIKKDIATDRAADEAVALHDKIEDARASGKTLAEAAKSVGLDVRAIPGVDAQGFDKTGAAVGDLPGKDALLRAVFASDVGADDQPIATPDRGFVWFEVTKIDPPHDRTLDEVKDRAAKEWRDEEVADALATKANDMVQKLNGGATLASLAEPDKLEVKTASDIHRRGVAAGLPENVVTAIFNAPPNGAGSVAAAEGRLVFKITADTVPPVDVAGDQIKQLQQQVNEGLTNDFITEYVGALQRQLGVSINQAALQAAEGS